MKKKVKKVRKNQSKEFQYLMNYTDMVYPINHHAAEQFLKKEKE